MSSRKLVKLRPTEVSYSLVSQNVERPLALQYCKLAKKCIFLNIPRACITQMTY